MQKFPDLKKNEIWSTSGLSISNKGLPTYSTNHIYGIFSSVLDPIRTEESSDPPWK